MISSVKYRLKAMRLLVLLIACLAVNALAEGDGKLDENFSEEAEVPTAADLAIHPVAGMYMFGFQLQPEEQKCVEIDKETAAELAWCKHLSYVNEDRCVLGKYNQASIYVIFANKRSCLKEHGSSNRKFKEDESILAREAIGPLRQRMSVPEVFKIMQGNPRRFPFVFAYGSHPTRQRWVYDKAGVTLIFWGMGKAQALAQIIVKSPSAYATRKGIKIGSDADAIRKAYGNAVSDDGPVYMSAGTHSDGLEFILDVNNKVEEMSLGNFETGDLCEIGKDLK